MRTSEAAASAQVNPQTLRYYERRGLIAKPERTGSGYRAYPDEAVNRVRFIKRAQAVGFSLTDIEVLLHLDSGRATDCRAAQDLAEAKVAELERRIHEMTAMRDTLRRFVTECDTARPPGACPMISELSNGTEGP
jgi:Hg(II)-responsive transcriptional regulator